MIALCIHCMRRRGGINNTKKVNTIVAKNQRILSRLISAPPSYPRLITFAL
jgi:hypothetical protein